MNATQLNIPQVETIFDKPVTNNAMQAYLSEFEVESAPFSHSDVQVITHRGLVSWAMEQGNDIQWTDELFDWRRYPLLFRQSMVNDLATWLDSEFQYLVPFRRLGRVILVAVLPTPVEQINVSRTRPEPRPRPMVFDPPIPFPALGLNNRRINGHYINALKKLVLDSDRNPIIQRMPMLAEAWAEIGATRAEMFYLFSNIQALISGAWKQIAEFEPVMTAGHVISNSANRNPAFPFQTAERLILGRTGQLNFLTSAVEDNPNPENIELR